MLEPRHILTLQLDAYRLSEHKQMPPPSYAKKQLTADFAAVGDATLTTLFGVTPKEFLCQQSVAREHGVSMLMVTQRGDLVGLSPCTSLIRGDIHDKNLVVPKDYMWKDPRLKSHYVLGSFIRGRTDGNTLPDIEYVEVAGWLDSFGLKREQSEGKPRCFNSKLPVAMVSCGKLNPPAMLVETLQDSGAEIYVP